MTRTDYILVSISILGTVFCILSVMNLVNSVWDIIVAGFK